MLQGCKYFPSQGGYCRNVPGEVFDTQCVSYQNRCFTTEEYIKRTGQVPPPRQSKETEIIHKGLEFIQGPISWFYFEIGPELLGMRRRFHFFGDAHFSKSNGCTKKYLVPCTQISPTRKVLNLNQRCYDITFLLMNLFKNAKEEKRYTDFLMELPFKSTPTEVGSNLDKLVSEEVQTLLKRNSTNLDYISTLYVIFNECFQIRKEECPYRPYVRFHYVDVRLSEKRQAIALNTYIFIEKLSDILKSMSSYYLFSYSIFESVSESELSALKRSIIDSVEFTNHLIEKLYLRGYTLEGTNINYNLELFNLALNSDNYVEDVNHLLERLLEGIQVGTKDQKKFEVFRREMVRPVVRREGKIQHRTRVQLRELAKENIQVNGRNLAELIVEFILGLYQKLDFTNVYSRWRKFYTVVYPAFLSLQNEDSLEKAQYELERYLLTRQTGLQLIEADALLLDGYILARMFRTFPDPRHEREPHVPSNRVITYTGAAHTDNYVRFFQEVFGLNPIDYRVNHIDLKDYQNIDRCLRNPKFADYFD